MTSSGASDTVNGWICPNCAATLQGDWCHACGQKRIADEERRFSLVLREFFAEITSLDGKLFRSFLALVLQPGRLGAEWIAGKRVRWMSPMALFVFINVLYFVAPPLSDFNLRLVDQVQNHPHSAWALERVEVRAPGITQWIDGGMNGPLPAAAAPYGKRFDERSTSLSKILIVTQVPLVALALLLLHWRRRIYFIDHFAVALHLWTFLLLSIIAIEGVVPTVGRWIVERGWVLNQADATKVWAAALFVLVLLNLVLTLRRSYGQGLPIAVIKSALVLATCVLSHFLYRGFLFVVTFYSL